MRLWSLHPRYLDTKGLVALWREGLLAKKSLQGKTRGYKNHPQLDRFKKSPDPVKAINAYLTVVLDEGKSRGSKFDGRKIRRTVLLRKISVTNGQIKYENAHLKNKLASRDPKYHDQLPDHKDIVTNPIFNVIKGRVEPWEVTLD